MSGGGAILLLLVLWGIQLFISYTAWKEMPAGAGMPETYRKARLIAIWAGIIPPICGPLLVQLVAFVYTKVQARSIMGASDLLGSASTKFSSGSSQPPPASRPDINPFGSSSPAKPASPPASNPFAAADSSDRSSSGPQGPGRDTATGEGSTTPDADNPFL